jgi:hypothetical protein
MPIPPRAGFHVGSHQGKTVDRSAALSADLGYQGARFRLSTHLFSNGVLLCKRLPFPQERYGPDRRPQPPSPPAPQPLRRSGPILLLCELDASRGAHRLTISTMPPICSSMVSIASRD